MAAAPFISAVEAQKGHALPRARASAPAAGRVARGLAAAGCPVTVFERGEAGRGASWAAAGMLAAGLEAEPGEERLLALNLRASACGRLSAISSKPPPASGLAIARRARRGGAHARRRRAAALAFEFQRACGIQLDWLSGVEARRLEPHLRPGLAGAVLSPNDHQVDSRRLVVALRQAFLAAAARCASMPRCELSTSKGTARGVVVGDERCAADVVVLRAAPGRPGSKACRGGGRRCGRSKDDAGGANGPGKPLLRHVLWGPKGYLVPKADGRLIVGGTVEERGFDPELTAGGVLALLEAAWRALPSIEELPIDELWTGFRPTSRDDAPILGPTPIEGLFVATGHHRNGIC